MFFIFDLKTMMELIAVAIQTDSTRAVTLTSGFVSGDFGFRGGYHGISHHGEREYEVKAKIAIEKNQIAQTAHLIDLLKAQPDPINGGSLFDHTMILYGCGFYGSPRTSAAPNAAYSKTSQLP